MGRTNSAAGAVERDLAAFYEQQAADRAARSLEPRRVHARDAFAARLVDAQPHILEIGVGAGHDAAAFAARGWRVVGVDLAVAHAELTRAAGVSVALATARALPFADEAFDVVWTMSTLMHVPSASINGALAEIGRVLVRGGVAAIGVWGGADVEDFLPGPYEPPRLFSRRSDARWLELLRQVGAIEEFEPWHEADEGFWYQWAVVRKPSE
ncbi:MAG: class I SAM-dependent methyltransferase [Acidimicrobiales bacterium]|nr:class I SAM-dependent methyltransferase [Acidimicrobiales bacterium]